MSGVDSWSPTKATNAIADGNDSDWVASAHGRLITADLRAAFNDLAWFQYGTGDQGSGFVAVPAVYASATSFTIAGADVTAVYSANRRVRAVGSTTGTIYGTIVSSAFASSTTTVNVSWDSGSLANETLVIALSQITSEAVPASTPTVTGSFLVAGGAVVWMGGYQYSITAAAYYIQGVEYTSAQQTVTLATADPTNPRIDLIAVDNTGTVVVIQGTAAANPSEPDYNPGTQLPLAFVLVSASTTAPPAATTVTLYADDAGGPTEWNWTTSGTGWTLNATTDPQAGTKYIDGTNVSTGSYAQGAIPSSTLDPSQYTQLVFYLKSKSTWSKNRGLQITLRSSGNIVGNAVSLNRTGSFGFDSSLTTAYQLVAIPLSQFGVSAGATITQIRFADFGGAINFELDTISIQNTGTTGTGGGAPVGASYVLIGANSQLANARILTAGTGITLTDGGAAGNATVGITNTAVSAATYGDATHVGQFTVNAQGQITAASSVAITVGGSASLTSGDIWVGNGSNVATAVAPSGDVTMSNAGVFTLAASGVTAATYGDSSHYPVVTVDAKGRITAASNQALPANPYIVSVGLPGAPLSNSQATYVLFEHVVTFPANFGAISSGQASGATGTANATGSTAFSIDKRSASPGTFGTNVGTITIGAGGITATLATAGGTSYTTSAGELWRIIAPSSADATFANFTATLVGTR